MIGHQLNGFTILAAAPETKDTWAILACGIDLDEYYQYVVSRVSVEQFPTPTSWGQGTYVRDVVEAITVYNERLATDRVTVGMALVALNTHMLSLGVKG